MASADQAPAKRDAQIDLSTSRIFFLPLGTSTQRLGQDPFLSVAVTQGVKVFAVWHHQSLNYLLLPSALILIDQKPTVRKNRYEEKLMVYNRDSMPTLVLPRGRYQVVDCGVVESRNSSFSCPLLPCFLHERHLNTR